ncbi:MAG: EAL domain-containing protein [Cyanobacteria bacterium P01_E01_bin.45]
MSSSDTPFHSTFVDVRSLAVRLTVAIVGLLAVSNAGITALSIRRKQHAFRQNLQYQAVMLIEVLDVATADALYINDGDYLNDLIQSVEQESSLVLGGRVYDANGWVLGDSRDSVSQYALEPDPFAVELLSSSETIFEWEDGRLVAGRTVTVGHETLGAISLELSTVNFQANISNALWQGFQAATVSIAAGTILALVIARNISIPLRTMVRATQKIAAGDLHQRLQETGGTELVTLARGFNQMTKQLHLNLLRKGAIQHYALDPIITLDVTGLIVEYNDAAEHVFGYQRSDAFGKKFAELIVAEPWQQPFKAAISAAPLGEPSDLLGQWTEIRARRSDGREFPADFSVSCVAVEGVVLFTVMLRDITERKRMEEQLRHEARHDPLTGLSNRSDFNQSLEQAFQHYKQDVNTAFAVLFLDFDRFKFVNDSLGHKIGDLLLVNIARRLQACVRPGDRVARLGGDEFTILLENVNDSTFATRLANRILQRLQSPFNLEGHQVSITASIGIVLSGAQHEAAEDILRDADITMYSAKAAGKNRSEVFNASIGEKAQYRWQLEQDLRQALQRQEFQLNYQPIIDSQTQALVGFEALLRWHHPVLGMITPNDFISIAEEGGTICSIGLWVLRASCQQMVAWQDRYRTPLPLTLSVNLSGKQIVQPDLVDRIEHILLDTGFAPERLKLEITETTLMDSFEVALAQCSALRALGIQIYIDDFGVGYSSLSYLNQLPIDALKIDRSFIISSQAGGNNWKIVQTIVALAKGMGLDTIAEGVEDVQQLGQLTQLGCNYLQGYLIAKPLNNPDAEVFLANACIDRSSNTLLPAQTDCRVPFS